MKFIANSVIGALIFVCPLTTNASTLYGLGVSTCGTWLEKRRTNDHFDISQWMLGYISAADYYGPDLKESEGQAFIFYMDNYCHQNPVDQFSVGVRRLIDELRKKR